MTIKCPPVDPDELDKKEASISPKVGNEDTKEAPTGTMPTCPKDLYNRGENNPKHSLVVDSSRPEKVQVGESAISNEIMRNILNSINFNNAPKLESNKKEESMMVSEDLKNKGKRALDNFTLITSNKTAARPHKGTADSTCRKYIPHVTIFSTPSKNQCNRRTIQPSKKVLGKKKKVDVIKPRTNHTKSGGEIKVITTQPLPPKSTKGKETPDKKNKRKRNTSIDESKGTTN